MPHGAAQAELFPDSFEHAERSLRRDSRINSFPQLDLLVAELREVNAALWQVENELCECEQKKQFGERFVSLARSVYSHNDRPANLKRSINELSESRQRKNPMPITRLLDQDASVLPASIQIEPVGYCNLKCRMCTVHFRERSDAPAFIDQRLFERVIDQFPPGVTLHLQGLGEPLLHPRFFEMVTYAARRGMQVTTNSNMTLLDRGRAEQCVRSGLFWMRISIDAASAETYESIRAGASFNRVLSNIQRLRSVKERIGATTPHLYLVMVLMRRNVSELAKMVELACRYGLEHIFVQHLCHDFGEEELPVQYRSMRAFVESETLNQHHEDVAAAFAQARARARELNIGLRLPRVGYSRSEQGSPGKKLCDWPWRSLYISYDGLVMPCCMIGTPDRMTLGSVLDGTVEVIWNSEPYRQFRSRLESDEAPSICRFCSVYKGIF